MSRAVGWASRRYRGAWGSCSCCPFRLRLQLLAWRGIAIGARVSVNGQMQEITAGGGFLSQHSKRLHFGLRGRASADVTIQWPSGLRQEIAGLQHGYTWTIVEGDPKPSRVPFLAPAKYAEVQVTGINDADLGDTWLLDPLPDPGQHAGPSVVLLYAGKRPAAVAARNVLAIDLASESDEMASAYALFRRYLFEYRTALELPLALLVDRESKVHKIYADIPSE